MTPLVLRGFAKPDRSISGVDRQGLPPAVHLSVYLRIAECSFHSYRNTQADVAVIGAGINVRLQVCRQHYVHAAIPGSDTPSSGQLGARLDTRINAPITRLYV